MVLSDVKIDGSTEYYCKSKNKICVIQATFVGDGACLIACDLSDENFLDLWTTEAMYLTPIKLEAENQ